MSSGFDAPYALAVPYALDPQGNEARPATARRDLLYLCPDCGARVIIKRGEIRRPHFSHLPDFDRICDFAAGESEEHHRAKHRIARLLVEGAAVRLVRACADCGRRLLVPLPRPAAVSLEHVLPGGLRADVALLDAEGQVVTVLEVRHLHAVDEAKTEALSSVCPWAEVEAGLILAGTDWPLLQDHLPLVWCERCREVASFGGWHAPAGLVEAACPLRQAPANLFADCAACPHFEDFDGRRVFCTGRKEGGGHAAR